MLPGIQSRRLCAARHPVNQVMCCQGLNLTRERKTPEHTQPAPSQGDTLGACRREGGSQTAVAHPGLWVRCQLAEDDIWANTRRIKGGRGEGEGRGEGLWQRGEAA